MNFIKDELFNSLTPREQKILEMRLGLTKEYPEEVAYRVIAWEFGVTRARIKQIYYKTLGKLRSITT